MDELDAPDDMRREAAAGATTAQEHGATTRSNQQLLVGDYSGAAEATD